MEDSPRNYCSQLGENKYIGDKMDIHQEETNIEPVETTESLYPDHLNQDTERVPDTFPCQQCERHFTCKQGLERHMHIHSMENHDAHAYKGNKTKPLNSFISVMHLQSASHTSPNTPVMLAEDHSAHPDKQDELGNHHACKYCEVVFASSTDKRQHEHMIHEQILACVKNAQLAPKESLQRIFSDMSKQETQFGDPTVSATDLKNQGEHTEQYMLDVSSNISENLSFYIDGKIVSTSTVSCESAEVHAGSSATVGLDALILDRAQISQVLDTDSVTGKDIPGQALAKRRTATPPLLPQIKTELESEVVVSSSSSSLVSTLIENLLPLNSESTAVQKERTVFLSPKLKQLLEKQDGLQPTLALIADCQKPCSPVSLSVLPVGTGKFRRRTGSPTSSSQQNPTPIEEMPAPDTGNAVVISTGAVETPHISPVHQTASERDDAVLSVEEPAVKPGLMESWPPMTGGNSCNQQPLDLSNTVKRQEHLALADAVLDLSLQKKSLAESERTFNLVSPALLKEATSNPCVAENSLINVGEHNISLGNPETPLVTDFTIVTGPDMVTPVEPLVYGLALPPSSLTQSSTSITPVTLQPTSPCTIAFASTASHAMLPSTPSLITVLTPSSPTTNPSSQVLGPTISPEPLVSCTENAFNSSECRLATAFAATNSSDVVTLSQPLDPTLNLPGHMFLTDQISLNPPIVDATPVSEVPFTPTVTLNDSFITPYNITSNTVLIECTIALETQGSAIPSAIAIESTCEAPVPPQMVVNHIEQQQIVSVPDMQTVDPTILMSAITESVSLSTATSAVSDCLCAAESAPNLEPVDAEPTTAKEEVAADNAVSKPEIQSETPPLSEKAEENKPTIKPPTHTPSDAQQQQTFTKNFICNVCDQLFHSMKELGHHVGDHADEWPYKCEFCVLLFGEPSTLLVHRSTLHGVGRTYVCSACTKEFVYLCNLKQHQEELHPGQQCTYTEEEKGKLRPQNYNNSTKVKAEPSVAHAPEEAKTLVKKEPSEVDVAAEELLTTIKIMASDGGKIKGPDVRLGINQHYPSFKPPPFPYHNRSPAGSMASATNFTTHNIPQTFSTAIRCTKCGKSFDNMPELHKHILACANASDKRRYTPKKNPIPLRHFAKTQNGVLSTTNSTYGLNASNRASQSNRSKPQQESALKMKFKVLNKRKKKLVQRVMPQRNKSVSSLNKAPSTRAGEQHEVFVCPHCSREFTMRRSRTKHMAVCPKKPKEVKKRKEGGISLTKENDGRLHRGIARAEEKRQHASPQHKTRFQTSGLTKRPAILPVQTVFSSKRSKIIIKESMQPKQETPTLNELPIVRTFNPAMRQYSRVQHSVKGIKITIVKQPTAPQEDELVPAPNREEAPGDVTSSPEQGATT